MYPFPWRVIFVVNSWFKNPATSASASPHNQNSTPEKHRQHRPPSGATEALLPWRRWGKVEVLKLSSNMTICLSKVKKDSLTSYIVWLLAFYPQKSPSRIWNQTQELKSLGINFCPLVQLNISLKIGTSTRRFHLTHDFHGGGLQLRILENAGSFPWDFMGFHGFCGWKSGENTFEVSSNSLTQRCLQFFKGIPNLKLCDGPVMVQHYFWGASCWNRRKKNHSKQKVVG